ncbi:uncharacterized protein N7506_006009 [Penicillium brevicompactum]|uniref:uncharacterized protein n=1 Tax=Penicillium brevicompactum TaxID=5074 RepID=UPI0025421805|nr:uncharacterized protein N7506_006009 [Penicillium brevicompactum]KAJ5332226.1 hypothetical protein N7506_006009 [Penicillium brevicompactum]
MEGEAAHRQMSRADTFELTPSKKQRRKLLTSKEVDSHSSHETQERRRKQIRVAQRAYRARQNDKLNEAQERIHKLEMTIESMAHAVASLHDKLVESDRLSNDTSIMTQLQETVKICLHSIDDSDIANGLHITEKTLDPISHTGNLETNTSCSPLVLQPRESGQVWLIPVSSFIEQLHVTCIYQGFLALSDSSLSLADLMTPFRFLLATVDRKRLISFFEAALHARLSQQRLEGWDDIPFFSLGGAGTKSTVSATCDGMTTYVGRFHEPARVIKDPLSDLSTRVKEDLDGDWLDMQDLERLLRLKVQHFIALPLQSSSRPSENNMGVAGLIKRLVDKAVCLGRSPGFRRYDVEKALLSNWH